MLNPMSPKCFKNICDGIKEKATHVGIKNISQRGTYWKVIHFHSVLFIEC